MPIDMVAQPGIINIGPALRLRAYDGNFLLGLPWYRDEVVYYNSEGITDRARIPDEKWVERMYTHFETSGESELYFIEALVDGVFTPIGDAAVQERNPPIVIGVAEYRGVGVGKSVLAAVIKRARELGFKKLCGTVIYDYNIASQKLYESQGFVRVDKRGNELIYELNLE